MAQDLSNTPPPHPTKSFWGSLLKGLLIGAAIGLAVGALLLIHPIAIAAAGAHLLGPHAAHLASLAGAHGAAASSITAAHTAAIHAAGNLFWPIVGVASGACGLLAGAGNLISKAINHNRAAKYQQAAQEQQYQQQQLAMSSPSLARGQAQYPDTGLNYGKNWSQTVSAQPDAGIDTSLNR